MANETMVLGINQQTATGLRVLAKRLEESEQKMTEAMKRFNDRFEENKGGLGIYETSVRKMIDDLDQQKKPILQTSQKVRTQAVTWAAAIENEISKHGS